MVPSKASDDEGVSLVGLVKTGRPSFVRKPGVWAELPAADSDWDAPETNAAIADELTGGELT